MTTTTRFSTNGHAAPPLDPFDGKLPIDRDIELFLIGGLISYPERIPGCGFHDTQFHDEQCRAAFVEMREMHRLSELVDTKHVITQLKSRFDADELFAHVSVNSFVVEAVQNNEARPSRWDEYSERFRETDLRRRRHLKLMVMANATYSRTPIAELLTDDLAQIEVLASESVNSRLSYPALSCRELFENRDVVKYYVENVLAADQPCTVAAAKKSMKTSIMLDLSVSLATGTTFLGEAEVPEPVRVGLMSGESGTATIRSNLIAVCEARGMELPDIGNLIYSDRLPQFGNAEHAIATREFIRRHRLKVLIVDCAYLAMPGADASNLFVQGSLLRGMNEVCTDEGATLVLVHHTKRGVADPYAVPELEDIAWAGFQEWSRQWLLIGRRERYEVGSGVHRLWLNCGGSAGHQFLRALDINEGTKEARRWEVSLQHVNEARQHVRDQAAAAREAKRSDTARSELERLLNVLSRYPDGETKTALQTATGLNGVRTGAAVALALDHQLIEGTTVTKNKKTFEAYKLTKLGEGRVDG